MMVEVYVEEDDTGVTLSRRVYLILTKKNVTGRSGEEG